LTLVRGWLIVDGFVDRVEASSRRVAERETDRRKANSSLLLSPAAGEHHRPRFSNQGWFTANVYMAVGAIERINTDKGEELFQRRRRRLAVER